VNLIKLADFQGDGHYQEEYKILQNFLADISSRKPTRLLSNPHYTKAKLIRNLIESLNRLEDNQAVFVLNLSSHPLVYQPSLECLQVCI